MALVYSTDAGRMCPGCRQPADRCTCRATPAAPVFPDGAVRLQRETKGRNGKAVTVVRGLGLAEPELSQWAKAAKAACGTGGTARDGVVEIQGDHLVRLTELLQAQGRKVKRVGG